MAINHYDLKFLESTTNLRPLVKRAFGREPTAKVARDIAVAIQQGRLFFEQAEDSPLQIRPLLVYYGVLSFARAVTAAIKNVELSALEQGHGLKDVGSPTSIERLTTTVQEKGTFQEFNNAIAPRSRFYFFDNFNRTSAEKPFPRADALTGKEISIQDVLSRIPTMERNFSKTFGLNAQVIRLDFHSSGYVGTTLRIDEPSVADDRAKLTALVVKLRTEYPFLQHWCFESSTLQWNVTILKFTNEVFEHDDLAAEYLHEMMPGTYNRINFQSRSFSRVVDITPPMSGGFDKDAYSSVMQPIGGVYLNEHSLQFLGVFLLASLVRYRPQIWQHALSRTATQAAPADDRSLSLIEEFVGGVLHAFPKLVINMLEASSTR